MSTRRSNPASSAAEGDPRRILVPAFLQVWGDQGERIDKRIETVDITDLVLRLDAVELRKLADELVEAEDLFDDAVPHDGPFEMEPVEAIADFFGVDRLADVTDAMIASARDALAREGADIDRLRQDRARDRLTGLVSRLEYWGKQARTEDLVDLLAEVARRARPHATAHERLAFAERLIEAFARTER